MLQCSLNTVPKSNLYAIILEVQASHSSLMAE